MESKVAGIDLGTTNSVIAVPGEYPEAGAVFGDITVISDEFDRFTHASAVCSVEGELTTGNEALEMARQGYTPARFVKKYMGAVKASRIGDKDFTPEEVSALVLRHLVTFAEKRLGVKIDRVVITHPAYFDGLAIQATRRAGQLAGLEVLDLIEEPTAAAIAYVMGDDGDNEPQEDASGAPATAAGDGNVRPLRVLVYDLGGGTFDITLLERSGSSFRRQRCGGNRELGGFNIDRKIALKMLEAMQGKGYRIVIDADHPERDPRWATLMYYAERMKCELGKNAPRADVIQASVFQDDSQPRRAVQLRFSMTQGEFRELIKPEVDETIRETRRVLAEAKVAPEDVGMLVLVGGSCRIVAIRERLKSEFGIEPQYDEDVLDLSVAVGAAAVARTFGTREGNVTLRPLPAETPDLILAVEGEVAATPKCRTVANLVVTVSGGQGEPATTLTGPNGKFFLEVPLQPEGVNQLEIVIQAADGNTLFSRSAAVIQAIDAKRMDRLEQRPMLAQAISVQTRRGLEEIAREGVNLPFKGSQKFRTKVELTTVPVTFYQDNVELTNVEVTGFSRPIPAGSAVEVELSITKEYQLTVTVNVPSANIKKTEQLKLSPLQIPTIEQLRKDFPDQCRQFNEQVKNSPTGERTASFAAEGYRLIDETEQLLGEQLPEALRIFLNIKRLAMLTLKMPRVAVFDPPKNALVDLLTQCRELLPAALSRQPELKHQEFDKTLTVLADQMRVAEQEEDHDSWTRIHKRLLEIRAALSPPSDDELPPASIIQMVLLQKIEEVRNTVESSKTTSASVKTEVRTLLDEGERRIQQVSLDNERAAQNQLIGLYHEFIKRAEGKLGIVLDPSRRNEVIEKW